METDFVVQTNEFEGPLNTLLSLIEKRKLYINDISLAKVTNDYVQFISNNQESIGNKIEFVRIASTLVLAKSKSLLPEQTTEDEQDEIDELEDRLRAFRLIKKRRETLADQFGAQPLFSARTSNNGQETEPVFAPGTSLTIALLAEKAKRSITSLPEDSLPTANVEKKVSLKDEIIRLQERCRQASSLSFSAAVRSDDKRDQVVLFVAILELVKGGNLEARQEQMFDEITLHHQS